MGKKDRNEEKERKRRNLERVARKDLRRRERRKGDGFEIPMGAEATTK
jgi:hypothetical protein